MQFVTSWHAGQIFININIILEVAEPDSGYKSNWFAKINILLHVETLMVEIPASVCIDAADIFLQISYLSHTKSQNVNVSRLVLQLSLPHILKLGVKSWMKM